MKNIAIFGLVGQCVPIVFPTLKYGKCFSHFSLLEMASCNFDLCKFPKEDEEILPPAELLADYYKKRAALDHEIDKTLAEIQKILGIKINIENHED